MKQPKFIATLALLLALLTLLSACGTYKPALRPTDTGEHESESELPTEAPPTRPEIPFTVELVCEGAPFVPEEPIYAQWNDGYSFHNAEIDEQGKASVTGLDGDYRVTLSKLPSGYAYNPNVYTATNDFRHVTIELYPLNQLKVRNTSLYKCISIKTTGFYHIQVEEPDDEIHFEFAPRKSGTYTVESMIDVTANDVNPYANYYGANAYYKRLEKTVDGGGGEGVYTKNFKMDVRIADEMISTGGQVVFTFSLEADSRSGQYPIDLYFAIALDGDYSLSHIESDFVLPTEPVQLQREYSDAFTFQNAEIAHMGGWLFDATRYKLWERGTGMDLVRTGAAAGNTPAEQLSGTYTMQFMDLTRKITFTPEQAGATRGHVEVVEYKTAQPDTVLVKREFAYAYENGAVVLEQLFGFGELDYAVAFTMENGVLKFGSGDGYYHLYDAEHDTYGPILYAYINASFRFYDSPLTMIEYAGNKALTISNGTENYKLFIEGFSALLHDPAGDSGPYFCTTDCPCRLDATCVGACTEDCKKCGPDCRRCPEEGFHVTGYGQRCNSDGVHAVTQELKDFLQKFSISQSLFRDGNGFVETYPARQIYAAEDDQWLFACGFYERNF